MAYSTPPTAVAGQKLLAADWNAKVRDSIIAAAKPPTCRVRRATSQSIPNNAATPISFSAEDWDTANMWAAGDPTKLYAPVAGIYLATFSASYAVNAAGVRQLYIIDNAGGIGGLLNALGNASWYVGGVVSGVFNLAAAGWVQCMANHTAGAALNLDVASLIVASLTLLSLT